MKSLILFIVAIAFVGGVIFYANQAKEPNSVHESSLPNSTVVEDTLKTDFKNEIVAQESESEDHYQAQDAESENNKKTKGAEPAKIAETHATGKKNAQHQNAVSGKNLRRTYYQLKNDLETDGRVQLTEAELDTLIMASADSGLPILNSGEEAPKGLLKNVKTEIKPGIIAIDMIIDTEKIPWESLPPDVQFVKGFLLFSSSSDLPCRISGSPVIEENKLIIDDAAMIQVAKMKFPLKTLLSSAGSDREITLQNASFSNIRFEEGIVILEK